jgi:hypothetical protein
MKHLILAATLGAFAAAVLLPATAVISSTGAFAAQKSQKAGKKTAKKPAQKKKSMQGM